VAIETNNQISTPRPTHGRRHVHAIFEGVFIRSEAKFVHDPPKKPATRDKIEPLGFQKVGPKSEQLGVTGLGHLVVLSRMGKCQFQHVLLHLKE
jgi:hypothetical protein